MRGRWRVVPIISVASPVIGGTPKRSKANYWNGNIPWATARDIASIRGRYLNETQDYISEEGLSKSNAKLMPKGTVVITARGTVGALCQLGRPMAFNQTCYALMPKSISHLDNNYLFYSLKGTLAEMRSLTYGSVFETITIRTFESWYIPIPPLSTQRAIAHILGTLDDKIELNRRMNETLEAIAQALFESWFVEFDPVVVNAIKAGNPIPDKFAKRAAHYLYNPDALGLPEHILRLFPASFQDSELGPIPEGWEVMALDRIAHFQNGLALQKFRPKPGESRLPVVKIAQLRSGRADGGEWASANIRPECIIDNGDVIFSWSGSLLITIWCGGRTALNQHLFKVTSDECPKWFYFHWILRHLPEFISIASGKATTMGHIKRNHLSEAKCVIPDKPLLSEANQRFDGLLEKQIQNEIESRTLATLRDTLLPKLISGEVRVPEVERFLKER